LIDGQYFEVVAVLASRYQPISTRIQGESAGELNVQFLNLDESQSAICDNGEDGNTVVASIGDVKPATAVVTLNL
jgi:hypothetical protein